MARNNSDGRPDDLRARRNAVIIAVSLMCLFLRVLWLCGLPVFEPEHICDGAIVDTTINVNSDPWWKLATLPNVGMVRAKRIVESRASLGARGFTCPADLLRVPGIGPKTIANLVPRVSFGANDSPGAVAVGDR